MVLAWVDKLQTGNLTREEVWLAVNTTIMRTLSYPIPALSLSKDQHEEILRPLLAYCLPRLGICRNFPHILVFASSKYFGIDFQRLHTLQEIARIKDLLTHTHRDDLTGKLYRASLEILLIETGHHSSLDIIPSNILTIAAIPSLIKSTLQFLNATDISIQHYVEMTPPRENDSLIMLHIYNTETTTSEVLSCNRYRLYLQALHVSDITTGDGIFITEGKRDGMSKNEKTMIRGRYRVTRIGLNGMPGEKT